MRGTLNSTCTLLPFCGEYSVPTLIVLNQKNTHPESLLVRPTLPLPPTSLSFGCDFHSSHSNSAPFLIIPTSIPHQSPDPPDGAIGHLLQLGNNCPDDHNRQSSHQTSLFRDIADDTTHELMPVKSSDYKKYATRHAPVLEPRGRSGEGRTYLNPMRH